MKTDLLDCDRRTQLVGGISRSRRVRNLNCRPRYFRDREIPPTVKERYLLKGLCRQGYWRATEQLQPL